MVNFTTAASTVSNEYFALSQSFEIIEVNQHKSSPLLFFLSGFVQMALSVP